MENDKNRMRHEPKDKKKEKIPDNTYRNIVMSVECCKRNIRLTQVHIQEDHVPVN